MSTAGESRLQDELCQRSEKHNADTPKIPNTDDTGSGGTDGGLRPRLAEELMPLDYPTWTYLTATQYQTMYYPQQSVILNIASQACPPATPSHHSPIGPDAYRSASSAVPSHAPPKPSAHCPTPAAVHGRLAQAQQPVVLFPQQSLVSQPLTPFSRDSSLSHQAHSNL
ncbi:hypothetical protein FN846DRAFT_887267 [Sphaerosporella brunnea]|uniref:Uncharacterized protein n=1 Tax=Sphaerosporella brunnea TaxID=1250544 RepID=A0A5J5F6G2_9PEZI|nr:hypothetical protein FN846DRAFT_887267 [Sphaerosporella brunnea]